MMIVKSLKANLVNEEKETVYSYRVIKGSLKDRQAFGMEVERIDYIDGQEVSIERECIKYISPEVDDVVELVNKLHKYVVSPIHVIDIIGEQIDDLGCKFDDEAYVCA